MQLQLHCINYTTQRQLHYTTTTATAVLHPTTSSCCGWGNRSGDHCNHCNHSKNNSNHLSVHQWIRSAIRVSQQSTSPIGFLFLKLPPLPCAALLVKNGPKWYRETSKHISSVGQVNHGESGGKNWKLCTEARPGKAQSDPEPHGLLSEFVSGECHQQYIAGKI